MTMPGRTYAAQSEYRYGFNEKEKDNDAYSTSVYDYGFRIYNPAISRFLSTDPLTDKYPYYTPYQFAGNRPINCIDLDGLEFKLSISLPDDASMLINMMMYKCTDVYELRKFTNNLLHSTLTEKELRSMWSSSTPPNEPGFGGYDQVGVKYCLELGGLQRAQLEYDENLKEGLTIEYNVTSGSLELGNQYIWKKSMHISFQDDLVYPDKGLPVDVRLIESPKFGNTYKNHDFLGTYSQRTTSVNAMKIGANNFESRMDGLLKGYGYVDYKAQGVGPSAGSGFGLGITGATGVITGSATLDIKTGKKYDITPSILEGWGMQIGASYTAGLGIEYGKWFSFNTLEDAQKGNFFNATFSGTFSGVSSTLGIGNNKPIGAAGAISDTKLVPLKTCTGLDAPNSQ